MQKVILTGVKPTGYVHIGNYIGAIKPALKLANETEHRSFLFIADYHTLTTAPSREQMDQMSYDVAATWIACGLNPEKTVVYRQSDVPEIFELAWILSCFTPKGLMNRAHAYKARLQENEADGKEDLDHGVNMGLYNYPVLMAADILTFDTDLVPVGEDQLQHLEITRDVAQKINHHYKAQVLKIPQAHAQKEGSLVPGLDGRKMSKSYDNTIPLFVEPNKLRKLVMKIKTDSLPPEAPKSTEDSIPYMLYKEFATADEVSALKKRYSEGVGWGEVKQTLFEAMDKKITPMREVYSSLIADRPKLEKILKEGAQQARQEAKKVLGRVRSHIGMS